MPSLYGENGRWLRLNLHTHTTRSDGAYTPEQCEELYASNGYDVLAMTDHWKQSENGSYKDMLLLSGCEWDVPSPGGFAETVHIVGVGMNKPVELERAGLTPRAVIGAIREADGAAILAHPAWSLSKPAIISETTGTIGCEIWNNASDIPFTGRPDSTEFFDQCAVSGVFLPAMAADDSHWYKTDAIGGWTWVYAADKTREAVLDALRAGRFYASRGPRIHNVVREGRTFTVDCDEGTVVFLSNACWSSGRVFENCTHAEYTAKDNESWIRVEVVDRNGRKAWTGVYSL